MPTMTSPTREEFWKNRQQGNLIPVWREVLADMETPVSAFRKIAGGRPNSFLLESVEGGERLARYSFLGSDPFLIFRSKGDTATITEGDQTETLTLKAGERDPLHVLKDLLGRYTYVPSPELPPFVGGAVGMIGYDTVRFFEKLPTLAEDDLGLDDCLFLFTDALLVFDNVKHKVWPSAMPASRRATTPARRMTRRWRRWRNCWGGCKTARHRNAGPAALQMTGADPVRGGINLFPTAPKKTTTPPC